MVEGGLVHIIIGKIVISDLNVNQYFFNYDEIMIHYDLLSVLWRTILTGDVIFDAMKCISLSFLFLESSHIIRKGRTSCTHANSVVFAHARPQLTLCIPAIRPKRNTFSHLHLHMHTFGNIFGNTTLRSNRYCMFNTSCFFHVHTLALIFPVLVGGCEKRVFF